VSLRVDYDERAISQAAEFLDDPHGIPAVLDAIDRMAGFVRGLTSVVCQFSPRSLIGDWDRLSVRTDRSHGAGVMRIGEVSTSAEA
jgi:hypothetical protein